MNIKKFLFQYATPLDEVPKKPNQEEVFASDWLLRIFGPEFVEQTKGHVQIKSQQEIRVVREHDPQDISFFLFYDLGAQQMIVHLIDGSYTSQVYSEFVISQEYEKNLNRLADALQQLTQAATEQEADQTTRLQKQMAEFNMRAQTWVPCDLEIYLIGQYAAAGFSPEQVVLKTKQLLNLLLNSEVAQLGSLRNPKVQAAIEKTLKKTKQQPDKEF